MSKNQPEIIIQDFQKGYLALPFNGDQFKEFVSSLLGQPQTINKLIGGKFEVHLKDLQNFHDLIDQRITQQNSGNLLQLKTQIFFSDNSSVLLSSLNELVTYNEVKPVISRKIILTWTYLIQFSDKTIPEKQEIELKISTNNTQKEYNISRISPIFFHPIIIDGIEKGYFEINIRHTARSWGSDIETLLTNQINSIILDKNNLKQIVDKYRNALLLLFIGGLSFACIRTLNIRNSAYLKNSIETVSPVIKNNHIGDKINYLVGLTTSDHSDFLSEQYIVCYTIIIVLSLVLSIYIIDLIDFKEKSFIVLTRESLKQKDEELVKEKNKISIFIFSYILSIIASIIASFVYSYFVR